MTQAHPAAYPATAVQRRMYLHSAAHPQDASFDLGFLFRITGDHAPVPLREALTAVLNATTAYTTTFSMGPGGLIADPTNGAALVTERDSRGTARAILEEDLASRLLNEFKHGPIAPSHPHQVRAEVTLGDDATYLAIRSSHIVADAYSFRRTMDTVARLYALPQRDWPDVLSELLDHPGNVSAPPLLTRGIDAYRELCENHTQAVRLADAHPGDTQRRGTWLDVTIDPGLARRIRSSKVAESHGIAALFFTAHATVLARLTGHHQVTVGVPVAGRAGYRAKRASGFFVNTLPLPVTINPTETWWTLAAQMHNGVRVAQMNQGMDPTDESMKDILGAVRPDVDNAVTFYATELTFDLPNAHVESLPLQRPDLSYPFMSRVADAGGSFLVSVGVAECYDATQALDLFQDALHQIVDSPEGPVIAESIIAGPETPVIQEHRPRRHDVIRRISDIVTNSPRASAIEAPGLHLTYAELWQSVLSGARELDRMNATNLVVVPVPKTATAVLTLLSVVASGRAYVPIDPEAPAQRRAYILDRISSALGTAPTVLPDNEQAPTATSHLTDNDSRANKQPRPADPSDPAYVIFTSGSTGEPKGVQIDHGALAALLDSTHDMVGAGPSRRWCLFHSLAFDFSVWEVFGPLCTGGTLIIPGRDEVRDPLLFVKFLQRAGITVLNQTPSAFRRLNQALSAEDTTLPDVELVIFGGEALHPADLTGADRFGNSEATFVNMYGITETAVHVTALSMDPADSANETRSLIGEPLDHLDVAVIDSTGQETLTGVTGELVVMGESLSSGYLGRDDLTEARFRNIAHRGQRRRGYLTGDLVRRDPDGGLVYLGRSDHQVQLRGHRIELGEVEAALAATGRVRTAHVTLTRRGQSEPFLCAWVVPHDPSTEEDRIDWVSLLRASIPDYMVPALFVELDEMPTTLNGKPDTSKLAVPAASGTPTMATADPDVARIADIWSEVFGIGHVGPNDRFFDVGGTSMHLLTIHERIRTEFQADHLSLMDLFEHATPRQLAHHLRSR
ncbi:amino acid adenylation domain-containing protein [Glutamicibacter protophormiae]|nr:amino acid adenylation domain-containing protein [Glutamicibacter protophormiae]